MKFTERYFTISIIGVDKDGSESDVEMKILPVQIIGWIGKKNGNTVIYVGGYGALEAKETIEQFENRINDFVGDPVTDNEKIIAMQAKIIDILKEP